MSQWEIQISFEPAMPPFGAVDGGMKTMNGSDTAASGGACELPSPCREGDGDHAHGQGIEDTTRPVNTLDTTAGDGTDELPSLHDEGSWDRGSHFDHVERVRRDLLAKRMGVLDMSITRLTEEYAALQLELDSGLEVEGDPGREDVGPHPGVHWETLDAGTHWYESQSRARGLDVSRPWAKHVGKQLDMALAALEALRGSKCCPAWNADDRVRVGNAPLFPDSDHGADLGGGDATPITPALDPDE